jgi:hypothetical protein
LFPSFKLSLLFYRLVWHYTQVIRLQSYLKAIQGFKGLDLFCPIQNLLLDESFLLCNLWLIIKQFWLAYLDA